MTGTAYRLAGPHISWEAFDEEYVILDLESGRYFSCAGGAAQLWRIILAGHDPLEIAAAFAAGEAAADYLTSCFAALKAAGLVRADGAAKPFAADLAKAFLAVGDDWRFEAFDDLAALLVADPIHETDREAGWPHQPA